MSFCQNCGKEINGNFCSNCGNKVNSNYATNKKSSLPIWAWVLIGIISLPLIFMVIGFVIAIIIAIIIPVVG